MCKHRVSGKLVNLKHPNHLLSSTPFCLTPKSDSLTPHILGATHTLSPKPAVFGNYFWLYAPESLPRCLRDHVWLDIQVELSFDQKASARNKTLATHAADSDSNPQKSYGPCHLHPTLSEITPDQKSGIVLITSRCSPKNKNNKLGSACTTQSFRTIAA